MKKKIPLSKFQQLVLHSYIFFFESVNRHSYGAGVQSLQAEGDFLLLDICHMLHLKPAVFLLFGWVQIFLPMVKHWGCDRNVMGLIPGRSGGTVFFSRLTFCAESYFGICSNPVLLQ